MSPELGAAGPARLPRVLFLCTRNSARSQLAEALLWDAARGAVDVASAGADPAMHVDPLTYEVLDELGIDWRARRPKGFDAVVGQAWDVVVTVCDHARDVCPALPGRPVFAHWPVADPCAVAGGRERQRRAFLDVAAELRACITELLALGLDDFASAGARAAAESRLAAIAARRGPRSVAAPGGRRAGAAPRPPAP